MKPQDEREIAELTIALSIKMMVEDLEYRDREKSQEIRRLKAREKSLKIQLEDAVRRTEEAKLKSHRALCILFTLGLAIACVFMHW